MSNHISWDEYFMGVAYLSALRSKDPNTKVGACIVNNNNRIIGIGYNGFPRGCEDDEFPWDNVGSFLDTKYPYVVHAEANAILNTTQRPQDATIFVTLFPCEECAKLIIQSGIKEIVYCANKENDGSQAAIKMFKAANIITRKMSKIDISIK